MKVSEHANNTEKCFGIRAEDIHKWIDGFFDKESFGEFLKPVKGNGADPYDHRKFRHCAEALEDAYREFEGKYTKDQIENVFECHIKDDYDGYLPSRLDFANGAFKERYHECEERANSETILSEVELGEYFKGKAYHQTKEKRKKLITGFHFRIVLPTIISTALLVTSIFAIIVPVVRNNMMEERKETIKELAQVAISIIDRYISKEKNGTLSHQAAQENAAIEIRDLRYGPEMQDYFWITDMTPKMVMHPYRPELIGQDLTNYQDSEDRSGKKLFVEFVNLIKQNKEGYLEYHWQWNKDPSRSVRKLSYVLSAPQWGWIVGTGIYIHDVEEQIAHLTENLLWIFLIVSVSLFAIVIYVVYQSRKIEDERLRAESGLMEAKERYRALVEASSEGYILIVEGKNIYSNHMIQRLLGYSELQLASANIWDSILPKNPINKIGRKRIKKLLNDNGESGEFEALLRAKNGTLVDVIINVSKIFFSQKNGHVISIRKITNNNTKIEPYGHMQNYDKLLNEILLEINSSDSVGHIVHELSQLPIIVRDMTITGVGPATIRDATCKVFETTEKKFIEIALLEMGTAPVEFAFVNLGSNARREMTMFSDQDNALIFSDVEKNEIDKVRRYFLELADKINTMLDKAGYPFCPGGIMAVNPNWCLSLSECKKRFSKQMFTGEPESIRQINTIFDIKCAYGNQQLADEFQNHMILAARENPEFFIYWAQNCLSYQVPLNVFSKIRPEKLDGAKTINIKDCIVIIVNFARIYALKNELTTAETLERLKQLAARDIIGPESLGDMSYVFDHLWHLRFYNQIICHSDLSRVNDELDLEKLSESEKQKLVDVLSKISYFQTKLSYDFLGISNLS